MHTGAQLRVGLRLPEHLACHRCGVPLSECQELEEISNRIAFRPAEIRMRNPVRAIADEQQQRGDGVRNRRACAAQHVMPADIRAFDDQDFAEQRRIRRLDLDEQHAGLWSEMVRLLCIAQLTRVFLGQSGVRPVCDDAHGRIPRLAQELFGQSVGRHPLDAQLGGAEHP